MNEQKPEEKPETKKKKLPINYMADEFMDQQLITLDKNKKGGKKMPPMPMQMGPMGPPHEDTWEENAEKLKIQIANGEKTLLMMKAQLKEAESHIKEE